MTYHMRFLITDPGPVDLADLAKFLRGVNRKYQFEHDSEGGTVSLAGEEIASIEINTPGDGTFDDELAMLENSASEGSGTGEARVADALATVQTLFTVKIPGSAGRQDGARDNLDPVWEWLFANRKGLLQADAEGYSDEAGMIFEVP